MTKCQALFSSSTPSKPSTNPWHDKCLTFFMCLHSSGGGSSRPRLLRWCLPLSSSIPHYFLRLSFLHQEDPWREVGGALLAKFLHTLLFQNTHTKATPAKGEETGMGWVMSALGILHVLQSDLKHPIIHLTKVEKLCYTLTFEFERRNHQNLLNSVQEGEVSKIWS